MVDRRFPPAAGVVVMLLAGLIGGRAAAAQEREGPSHSRDEVANLARRGETDQRARDRLREIRTVDGRPRPIGEALEGGDEGETRSRLRHLARLSGQPRGPLPSETETRQAARQAVQQPAQPLPEPEPRQTSWLARVLGAIADFLAAVLTSPFTLALVLVVVGVLVYRALRGRARKERPESPDEVAEASTGPLATARGPGLPAEELDRAARDAEQRGDLDLAVRLIFQAGLARLVAAGRLAPSDTIPNAAVRRTLRSQPFDLAADGFERVLYGQRPAAAEDVHTARAAWAEVLR